MSTDNKTEQDRDQELYGARPDEPYRMTIDLNVIDHLGLNLYSNISAVLTEAVANAWDADADEVRIDIEMANDTITIADDGCGMTKFDMNKKYLHVGYRKRSNNEDITGKGRPVMGRKGLGKLSLFSLADIIEVQSAKDGERHGLVMNVTEMKAACSEHASQYAPKPLPDDQITVTSGTQITLHKIKRPRLEQSIETLRMQLARRFSVIGESSGFKVFINGQQVTVNDRCELKNAQFLWKIGGATVEIPEGSQIAEEFDIPGDGTEHSPKGWIATVCEPKQLVSNGANLNGIVVLARGRLIQEDILSKFNDARHYTNYLTGQISYDLLDDTTAGADVATSDRQRIKEDDPRYLKLLEFLKGVLTKVESDWKKSRPKHEIKKALKERPALGDWLSSLKEGTRKTAEQMLAKVVTVPMEREEDRSDLIKHSILAFERMELRGSEVEFAKGVSNVETLLTLLSDRDSLEAALYHDIVRSRIDAIRELCEHVQTNQLEAVLQKYLFDHLWLLDPSWDRVDGSAIIEQSLKTGYKEFAADLTDEESKGRVDIRYRTSAGAHIIVELKRAHRIVTATELVEQGEKYYRALHKCLEKQGEPHPNIQIVFVLGEPIKGSDDKSGPENYIENMLAATHARVLYYNQMIASAGRAYSEYLEQDQKLNKVDQILAKI